MGPTELYDLSQDPWQQVNLAGQAGSGEIQAQLALQLREHQAERCDQLVPCTQWSHWLDNQRRVVRNAFGELSHPESLPDWSLLHR